MHLKKLRARKMMEILMTMTPYEHGNHRIELHDTVFIFYYRGTPILAYDFREGLRKKLDAGEYENTPSTRAQRKMIYEAIEEFEQALAEEQVNAW